MSTNYDYDTTPMPPLEYDQSKVPELSHKHANYVRNKTYGHDVRESLARGVEYAGLVSSVATKTAQDTKLRQDNLEAYNDQVIAEITDKDVISAPEIIAAHVDSNGTAHPNLKSRLDNFEVSATQQLQQTNELFRQNELYSKIYGTVKKYVKPADFNMSIPFELLTSVSGKVVHNYKVSQQKNKVTKRYYVDVKNGNNNNDGSEATPFKSLERAFRYGDGDEIILKEGVYDWVYGQTGTASNASQKKKVNIIGVGNVYFGAHRGYRTWTVESGNTYKTTISSVVEIIDINNYENPVFYKKVNGVSEVISEKGTYFIVGSDVYVHPLNNTEPNDKILLNMLNNALELNNFENVYLENIKFTNTFKMENNGQAGILNVLDCDFCFGSGDNAVSLNGDITFCFQNSRALHATKDGFNYHMRNGQLPKGLELECVGAYNGRDGGNSNNGSTMHDGGKVIRVNGEYHHNHGPNVIDVNDGTQSLNVGTYAHHSTATSPLSNVDFRIRNEGGGSDMWLVNCVSNGSEYSVSVEGNANKVIENSLLMSETIIL